MISKSNKIFVICTINLIVLCSACKSVYCNNAQKQMALQIMLPHTGDSVPVRFIPDMTSAISVDAEGNEYRYYPGDCVFSSGKSFSQHGVEWLEIIHPDYGWIEARYLKPSKPCEEGYAFINKILKESRQQSLGHKEIFNKKYEDDECECGCRNLAGIDFKLDRWMKSYLSNKVLVINYDCNGKKKKHLIERKRLRELDDKGGLFFFSVLFEGDYEVFERKEADYDQRLLLHSERNDIFVRHEIVDYFDAWSFHKETSGWKLYKAEYYSFSCE